MSTLDSLKDPRSIASISAIFGIGISWAYFQGEISKIKNDVAGMKKEFAEMRKHLTAVILTTPESNKQYEQLSQAIKLLESKLEQDSEQAPRGYQRLTKREAPTLPVSVTETKKPVKRPPNPPPPKQVEPELPLDIDDDVAAMQ